MTAREKALELIRNMPDLTSLDPYSAQSTRLVALRLAKAEIYQGKHAAAIELTVPGLLKAAKGIPARHANRVHLGRRWS